MVSHRRVVVVFLMVVALGVVRTRGAEAPSDTASESTLSASLEGIWRVIAMADAGSRIPAARLKQLRFEFSSGKLAMQLDDRVLAETDITIDESTEPASVEMVFQGKPTLGILALEGNRLRICLSGSKEVRPDDFASRKDSPNRMLIDLRRGEHEPGHPIHVIRADGTGLRQLEMPKDMACGSPDWSPDGTQIAFDAWHLAKGENYADAHITIAPANGGELVNLGPGCMPSWSPDGKRLAFCRYQPRGVWLMNADGTGEKLIDDAAWGVDWSPTANEIAYTCSSPGGENIAIVDPDTGARRTLLEAESYRSIYWNLSWAPDGKSICFVGVRPDGTKEVARVSAEGDKKGFLVLFPAKTAPRYESLRTIVAWAGSKDKILVSMKGPEDRFRQIYILDAEGKAAPVRFPGQDADYDNGDMAWSSDGKQMAFVGWEPE